MNMKAFFCILLLSLNVSAGEILVATVAQVKNHVITSREVQIHYLLERSLGKMRSGRKDKAPVENIIREWLLFYEAESFYNTRVSRSKERELYEKAQKKMSSVKNWKRLGVTDKELRNMVKRRLEAERLYLFKKKASVLPVSSEEVAAEYTQNRIRYGNLSFDDVKDQIRNRKIQQNLMERLNQWFRVLEKKYRVQRFASYNDSKK